MLQYIDTESSQYCSPMGQEIPISIIRAIIFVIIHYQPHSKEEYYNANDIIICLGYNVNDILYDNLRIALKNKLLKSAIKGVFGTGMFDFMHDTWNNEYKMQFHLTGCIDIMEKYSLLWNYIGKCLSV